MPAISAWRRQRPSSAWRSPHTGFSGVRRIAIIASACALAIAASATGGFVRSADADNTVTWEKSPATVQVLACDPLSPLCPDTPVDLGGGVWQGGVVLTEIMNNQGDPHGLGGYQLNVLYDPWVFQDAEIADAGAIDDGGVRSTTCAPTPSSPGNVGIACTSTGPYGVGAVWSGPMVMAHVTLKLQPGVYYTIENGPSGGITTWVRDSIRVTNTCGQPLNDGTIQPLPGQQECQGNLLPGLGASGVVLSPGQSTVTVLPPPSTPTPTATQTATKTPTATHTATRTPTATGTAITTTATVTTVTPTGTRTPGTTTPTKTSTPAPSGTPTTPVTSTPGPTKTPGPCSRDREYWRDHPDDWPIDHLSIGGEDYNKAELLYVLWGDTSADPSIALAQELIAAKLNAAAGHPRPPADVVALGDTLLAEAGGRLPQHQDRTSYRGQGMLWVAGSLASHERDDDCESRPPSHTPTAVNTVLGSARPGEPSTLPQTGDPSTIGNKLRSRILTGAALVTVSVFVVVTRRLVRKRDD